MVVLVEHQTQLLKVVDLVDHMLVQVLQVMENGTHLVFHMLLVKVQVLMLKQIVDLVVAEIV